MLDDNGLAGQILACDPQDFSLAVRLPDGSGGSIPFREITRQTNLSPEYAARQVGRTLCMLPAAQPGVYSIRAYEEAQFERIREGFLNKTRNTYRARFKLIAPGGKLAFYQLAQGVNGAVHVKEFSCGRIDDFNHIEMPRELPVIVREIDGQGRLVLTAKPAFGTFQDAVERLNIAPGEVISGTVCFQFPKAAGVMLTPNIMTLADAEQFPPSGSRVQVEITRVDCETHKIRSRLIGPVDEPPMRHADWIVDLSEGWTDLAAFSGQVEVKKPALEEDAPKAPPEPPSFHLDAERSPFSTYPSETIVREAGEPAAPHTAYRLAHTARADERLCAIAQAVEELRYSTAWQLQRYLYLRRGLLIERSRLGALLDRLSAMDVIAALRFSSGGVECKFKTYLPSRSYHCLMERNPRNFGEADLCEENAARVKARLAANQLLLGMMNESRGALAEPDTHPYLFDRVSGVRVRPKHAFSCGGSYCLLDAFRQNDLADCEEKLARYARYFEANPQENLQLCLVVEDAQVDAFAAAAERASLPFPVLLTTDLACLPEPRFAKTVLPQKKSRLKQFLDRLIR